MSVQHLSKVPQAPCSGRLALAAPANGFEYTPEELKNMSPDKQLCADFPSGALFPPPDSILAKLRMRDYDLGGNSAPEGKFALDANMCTSLESSRCTSE
ncbi:hypothetical protein PSHT_09640 [Puccinia striiformis]|uniref:Uncharacterized protein n=1 Tax=Puccinia striiformis TaxID=27350 RepID=A0A2S4VFD3_9BASI|nr:hypothetical protein PSHT_09640 [Puccinia striiformis]